MRLLLIEDERGLADALAYTLKKQHYSVDLAYDGLDGLYMAESGIYDLIILDRMLPSLDGLEILKRLRMAGNAVPVIILTARDATADRVDGLDAGADDYLIKPFASEELLARIRALKRRATTLPHADNLLRLGGLTLEPEKLLLYLDNRTNGATEMLPLTLTEMQLLELLMRHPDQTLSKELIFQRIWGFDSDTDISCVELYIHYLRKKIDPAEAGVVIQTVRGLGYRLTLQP